MNRAWLVGILVLLSTPLLSAVFEEPQSGLSFSYDEANWEPTQEKATGAETLLSLQRKTPDKEGDTVYFSRISIVKEPLDKISKLNGVKLSPLQSYQNHAVNFLKSQRFDVISAEAKKDTTLPGGAFEVLANQRDFGLTFQQMGFVTKDSGFLITATVRTKKFPEYKEELSKLFQSVKLSPKS